MPVESGVLHTCSSAVGSSSYQKYKKWMIMSWN